MIYKSIAVVAQAAVLITLIMAISRCEFNPDNANEKTKRACIEARGEIVLDWRGNVKTCNFKT
jgi:hypothetical protein